jgi:hypothetical protein
LARLCNKESPVWHLIRDILEAVIAAGSYTRHYTL